MVMLEEDEEEFPDEEEVVDEVGDEVMEDEPPIEDIDEVADDC